MPTPKPAARAAWQAAVAAREAAEEVPRAGEEKLAALRARLAKLEERAAEAAKATEVDDLDAYLVTDPDATVNARSMRLAIEEELAEVRQRIGAVGNLLSPPIAALRAAEHEEAVAKGLHEQILEAAVDPLDHRRAWQTDAFRQRMIRLCTEVLMVPDHPEQKPATDALMATLAASGVGAEVETRAIEAYVAGNYAAQRAGGGMKHWADGITLVNPPDGPPVVFNNRATPAQIAAAPGVPQVDTSPASAVIAQAWAGTGQAIAARVSRCPSLGPRSRPWPARGQHHASKHSKPRERRFTLAS